MVGYPTFKTMVVPLCPLAVRMPLHNIQLSKPWRCRYASQWGRCSSSIQSLTKPSWFHYAGSPVRYAARSVTFQNHGGSVMPFLTCYLPRYFFTFKTMVVPLCLTPEEKQELDAKGYLVSPTFTFKTMVVPLYPKELRDRLETYVFQNHPGAIMPVRPGNVHVCSTFLSKPRWCRYARFSYLTLVILV